MSLPPTPTISGLSVIRKTNRPESITLGRTSEGSKLRPTVPERKIRSNVKHGAGSGNRLDLYAKHSSTRLSWETCPSRRAFVGLTYVFAGIIHLDGSRQKRNKGP